MSLLEIQDLCISFAAEDGGRIPAVRNLHLALDANEVLCIVGESGSGKSVTARSILRLDEDREGMEVTGRILFAGENLLKISQNRMRAIRGSHISMIFQDPLTSLNPVYTVGEQMTDLLRLHHPQWTSDSIRQKALSLLSSVEIADGERVLASFPFAISGGMRQRVMIAMALSCEPQLLIADEPTTALDVTVQAQILRLLLRMKKDLGLAIVFITHDLALAYQIADRIAVFEQGRVIETGSRENIFFHPRCEYTKKLLNSMLRV